MPLIVPVMQNGFESVLIKRHKHTTKAIWHTVAIESILGVSESVLNISFGVGITNQMKFGIIMTRNSTSPRHSKPNLYFFSKKYTSTNPNLSTLSISSQFLNRTKHFIKQDRNGSFAAKFSNGITEIRSFVRIVCSGVF